MSQLRRNESLWWRNFEELLRHTRTSHEGVVLKESTISYFHNGYIKTISSPKLLKIFSPNQLTSLSFNVVTFFGFSDNLKT